MTKANKKNTNDHEKLDNLPESSHKFWRWADTKLIEVKASPRCRHYFIRRSGREVECEKCGAGFFLTPEWTLREGHLYLNNKKVL
jgi:hypothetical protein